MDVGPDARGADRPHARGDGGHSRAWPSPSASPSPAASTSSWPARGPSSSSSCSARTSTSSRTGPANRRRRSAGVRGATDLIVESVAGQPYITVQPDRARIARLGLNVEDVQAVVETAVGGKTVTQIYEGDSYFDLQLRYPEERRNSPEAIGAILVRTPGGARVPLGQIAEITMVEGPSQISRESGQRRIGVECNISGRDLGGFVAEARRAIGRDVPLPAGYFLDCGGQFENQQRAMRRLAIILPATIGLILFLLFLTFGSLQLSLLVLLNLPFALIGGVLALYFSGLYLSVPASVGFIALFGIAVLNGIVLLSYISSSGRRGGRSARPSSRAALNRLRPVLMTATITDLQPRAAALRPGPRLGDPAAAGGRRRRRADHLDPADAPRPAGALQLARREAEGAVTARKEKMGSNLLFVTVGWKIWAIENRNLPLSKKSNEK